MASNIIGPATLAAPVQIWFEEMLLALEIPNYIHGIAAQRKQMPGRSGVTWRGRRYNLITPNVVPLDEDLGVEVPPTPVSKVDVDARLRTYGQYVKVTETTTATAQDPIFNVMTKLLAEAMRGTEDQLFREILATSATFLNATGGTNGDNPTNLAYSDIQRGTKLLQANKAKTIAQNIEAQNKFGTAPQRNAYFALCHTDLSADIEALGNFTHVSQYPDQSKVSVAEWGQSGSFRFFLSTEGKLIPGSSLLGNDVYEMYVPAMESYGVIDQNNFTADLIYHSPKYADALEQYWTLAYKMRQAPIIFNDAWVLRMRCTLLI